MDKTVPVAVAGWVFSGHWLLTWADHPLSFAFLPIGNGDPCGHPSPNSINSDWKPCLPRDTHTLHCFSHPGTVLFFSITQGCGAGPQVMHWREFSSSQEQLQGSPVDQHSLFWCHSPSPAEYSVPLGSAVLCSNSPFRTSFQPPLWDPLDFYFWIKSPNASFAPIQC